MKVLNRHTAFRGEFAFLSNFSPAEVKLDHLTFPTIENAFASAKTTDLDLRKPFTTCTPSQAKRMGRELQLRPDWDKVKLGIMANLLKQKFASHNMATMILATGDMELVEYNYWHDNFWGSCTCAKCGDKGLNYLGKLLTEVREELNLTC